MKSNSSRRGFGAMDPPDRRENASHGGQENQQDLRRYGSERRERNSRDDYGDESRNDYQSGERAQRDLRSEAGSQQYGSKSRNDDRRNPAEIKNSRRNENQNGKKSNPKTFSGWRNSGASRSGRSGYGGRISIGRREWY